MVSKRTTVSAVVILTMLMFSCIMIAPLNDADASFDIVDVNGNTVHFDEPAKHVVTMGVGFTQTAIDLGIKGNIIGVDYYSTSNYTGNESFSGLRNLGNYYNVDGRTEILTTLVQLEDQGLFQQNELLILAPNYSSITNDTDGLIKMIQNGGYGYKVLMLVASTTSYDDVIDMVGKIGKAMGVENISGVTYEMESVKAEIVGKVNSENLSAANAIHIGSYDPPRVYNRSMLLSMVEIVKGVNLGLKGAGTNYTSDYSEIVQLADTVDRVVIFLDAGHPMSASEFKGRLGNMENVEVVKMEAEWNNACPSISDGLQAVAAALYPDHFEWNVNGDGDSGNGNDLLLYVGAGVAICAVIGILAYLLIRKK